MREHEYNGRESVYFAGQPGDREENKKDLIDAREAVLALDFCFLILDAIERSRTDKIGQYVMPLTLDMRHDLLVYLISGERERQAIFLVLKALLLRRGGSAN
jgi:hypothetical protein